MFHFFSKKNNIYEVKAPFAGRVIPVEEVKDDVFAQLMMGDGVAIIPKEGNVYAPLSGVISAVATTFHALGITSQEGIELIVHYGIDTVKHQGKGFKMMTEQGQKVQTGDLLIKADMAYFEANQVDLTSPILVTNSDVFEITEKPSLGKEVSAGDTLYFVKKK